MSKEKKSGSCFGLFFKSLFISTIVLALTAAGIALIAVKGFGSDLALWTDFSSPTSRAWLSVYLVAALSFGGSFLIAVLGAVVSKVFAGGAKGSSSKPRPKSRPQSSRRTTV